MDADLRLTRLEHDMARLKQWAKLANEALSKLVTKSSHGLNAPALSEEEVHEQRLRLALIKSLPVEASALDILPQYYCTQCDHRFEIPAEQDLSDHKGFHSVDVCPECGARRPFGDSPSFLMEESKLLTF